MSLFGQSDLQELFAFNLLPPRSKEEIEEEAKKRRAFVYSFMIPGGCLIVALIIFLLNIAAVEPNKNKWEIAVQTMKTQLSDPNNQLGQLKITNGELVKKTDLIVEPVQKNVDFNKIFSISEAVFGSDRNTQVTSYGREDSGQFLVNAISRSEDAPAEILEKFKEQPEVKNANIRLVQKVEREYRFSVAFDIEALSVEGENIANPV